MEWYFNYWMESETEYIYSENYKAFNHQIEDYSFLGGYTALNSLSSFKMEHDM